MNFAGHTLKHPSDKLHQQGLSLVELMIAIVIGLLITAALITLFVNMSRTTREMAKTNAQIENGRFALQLIQNDLVHAGYWGGYIPEFDDLTASTETAPGDVPTAVPDPCTNYTTANWTNTFKQNLIGIPVQAYETVPTECADTEILNKQNYTDILVIRHAATCIPGDSGCDSDEPGNLYFQAAACETNISAGNKWVLADDADDDGAEFPLLKRGCTASDFASKRQFISHIYYISNNTLMRSEFALDGGTPKHKNAEALISGIESFRVELGIDNLSDSGAAVDYTTPVTWADPDNLNSPTNRGDGIPDDYVRCPAAGCTAAQLMNAVSVKLYVLARSDTETKGYIDSKTYTLGTADTMCITTSTDTGCVRKVLAPSIKRHVFTTTVRLNNISGRRETP